ncbi:MAG: HPr family phosphocarrier protein [Syntrophobacterales bacterium]|nr:HPr family phosphocarrier protein [Syntrophobacterales bacterium]
MKMVKTFVLKNELGLHARAAAMMVKVTTKYKSTILFESNGNEVDGKSILSILTLACPKGGTITINAEGEDACDAIKDLEKLIENKFGEN